MVFVRLCFSFLTSVLCACGCVLVTSCQDRAILISPKDSTRIGGSKPIREMDVTMATLSGGGGGR